LNSAICAGDGRKVDSSSDWLKVNFTLCCCGRRYRIIGPWCLIFLLLKKPIWRILQIFGALRLVALLSHHSLIFAQQPWWRFEDNILWTYKIFNWDSVSYVHLLSRTLKNSQILSRVYGRNHFWHQNVTCPAFHNE
jgi:hypothetical protein